MLSVLDIFRIGIGPSSSHTVGPMRISRRFVRALVKRGLVERTARVTVELQGSLALTGIGHGTLDAAILGLAGFAPDRTDPDEAAAALAGIKAAGRLSLAGHDIAFDPARDIDLAGHIIPKLHPNGMLLRAYDRAGALLLEKTYYSTGGGFVASEAQLLRPSADDRIKTGSTVPFPFGSAEELLALCAAQELSIADLVLANEDAMRSREQTEAGLDTIAQAMDACIERGLHQEGIRPGGVHGLNERLSVRGIYTGRDYLFDLVKTLANTK